MGVQFEQTGYSRNQLRCIEFEELFCVWRIWVFTEWFRWANSETKRKSLVIENIIRTCNLLSSRPGWLPHAIETEVADMIFEFNPNSRSVELSCSLNLRSSPNSVPLKENPIDWVIWDCETSANHHGRTASSQKIGFFRMEIIILFYPICLPTSQRTYPVRRKNRWRKIKKDKLFH